MERAISPEERIRRAEEIYYRRKSQGIRVSSSSVNVGNGNKVSLGKKMIIQILICVVIYTAFLVLKGYNNVFSENVINQTKSILSYDINFEKLYIQCVEYFNSNFNSIIKKENDTQNEVVDGNSQDVDNNNENEIEQNTENQENSQQNGSEQSSENSQQDETMQNENEQGQSENSENQIDKNSQNTDDNSQSEINDGTQKAKLDAENEEQMNEDAEYVKQNVNLVNPIQGTVTSRFGNRDETEIISAFHQGIDIAAVTGTAIHSAMDGTVVAAKYVDGYGNHVKIQNGEILTVYAHCSELEVKIGDYVSQNQEVAKVGATGDVTGPHLHFEVRRDGRYINPELILKF